MQELNEAQKKARLQRIENIKLKIADKKNELHSLHCEKEILINKKCFDKTRQEEYKKSIDKINKEIYELNLQINQNQAKPKSVIDSNVSKIIKDREEKSLKKAMTALSCVLLASVFLFIYLLMPSENDKEPMYPEIAITSINQCLSKTYTDKASCSTLKIDNRDVYSCSIRSTKFVFEMKDLGQNTFFIFALNGKAKQLVGDNFQHCRVVESYDYEFANKVMQSI